MQPILLSAGMSPGKSMRLSMIAMSLGVHYREISPSEYALPLCALLGEGNAQKIYPPCLPVSGEMIVMAYFPNALLDALLQALRRNDLSRGVLKAVLTDTNRFWSCGQLYAQLRLEEAQIQERKS